MFASTIKQKHERLKTKEIKYSFFVSCREKGGGKGVKFADSGELMKVNALPFAMPVTSRIKTTPMRCIVISKEDEPLCPGKIGLSRENMRRLLKKQNLFLLSSTKIFLTKLL